MEYCASAASIFAEEFWRIVEGFVEVLVNLKVQIKNVEEISWMINNVDCQSCIGKTILWKKCSEDCDILQNVKSIMWYWKNFHNVESLIRKLPQCGKYANKTSTMWKVLSRKLPQCGKYANKTSTMWNM